MNEKKFRQDTTLLWIMGIILICYATLFVLQSERPVIAGWLAAIFFIDPFLRAVINTVSISNEKITTTTWRGHRSMNWEDITRLEFGFFELRLVDDRNDKHLIVEFTEQNSEEVLKAILIKCQGLVNDTGFFIVSHNVSGWSPWVIIFTGIALAFSLSEINAWLIILLLFSAFQLYRASFGIFKLRLENGVLYIERPLRQRAFNASDVESISLEKQFTRGDRGYREFIKLHLPNGRKVNIRIGYVGAFFYQRLIRWHPNPG